MANLKMNLFRPKLILDMRGRFSPASTLHCPHNRRCIVTHDTRLAELSDAIIFCVATICQAEHQVRRSVQCQDVQIWYL